MKNLLVLFTAAVTPIYQQNNLGIDNLGEFLSHLLEWSLTVADNELQRMAAVHLASVLVNRKADGTSDATIVMVFLSLIHLRIDPVLGDTFVAILAEGDTRPKPRHRKKEVSCCHMDLGLHFPPLDKMLSHLVNSKQTSKALVVQSHPLALNFSEKLFELFSDPTINWDAAKGVGIIPGHNDILTKAHHAVLRILYAQKYVKVMLPQTIAGSVDASDTTRQVAYLVSLSGLIKAAPKATYHSELPSVGDSICSKRV